MSVIERDIDTMKEELKQRFVTTAQINYGRELSDLSEHELYETLAQVVKQYTSENWINRNPAAGADTTSGNVRTPWCDDGYVIAYDPSWIFTDLYSS